MAWNWEKRGLLFCPTSRRPWMHSHAQAPLIHWLDGHVIRVFFATRDEHQRSHAGFVDVDVRDWSVSEPPMVPALAPGPLGTFDDHGVYPTSIVRFDDGSLGLYYIGWNPGPRPPLFYATIGLATSHDDGRHFTRVSSVPVMGRSEYDPCFVTSPCVRREDGVFRMWYVSGMRWEEHGGALQSFYDIKHAESSDGRCWERSGVTCIPLEGAERNLARPWVQQTGQGYSMFYSRSADDGYRLGYAESVDGVRWTRLDHDLNFEPSPSGWDSDAVAYPCVTQLPDGRWLLLYNGGGFGRDGFGYAIGNRDR